MDTHNVEADSVTSRSARLPKPELEALISVVDAMDVETCLFCEDEAEARKLILKLLGGLGFEDVDVVSVVHRERVARVRARVYVSRPWAAYAWLGEAKR